MTWESLSLVVSLFALACATWSLTRGAQASLRRAVGEAQDRAQAAVLTAERIEAAEATRKAAQAAFFEECEGVLESVERKRRSAAGAAARAARANPELVEEQREPSRQERIDEIRRRMRGA